MPDEEIKKISELRLQKAVECLGDAKKLFEAHSYNGAANRAYYAVFHSMRAVLIFDGADMKHHSGIIAEFRKLYVKTGVFDKEMSDTISELYDLRTDSDYDDFYFTEAEETEYIIQRADKFLFKIKEFLQNKR